MFYANVVYLDVIQTMYMYDMLVELNFHWVTFNLISVNFWFSFPLINIFEAKHINKISLIHGAKITIKIILKLTIYNISVCCSCLLRVIIIYNESLQTTANIYILSCVSKTTLKLNFKTFWQNQHIFNFLSQCLYPLSTRR